MNKLTKNLGVTLLLSSVLLLVGCSEKEVEEVKLPNPVMTSVVGYSVNSSTNSPLRATALTDQNESTVIDVSGVVEGLHVKCFEVSEEQTSGSDETAIISVTDENGTFFHRINDKCQFMVTLNASFIGIVTMEQVGIVTPQGMSSRAYVNTLRTLYSLDEDHNRSNGVKIPTGALSSDVNSDRFEEIWQYYVDNNGQPPLMSAEEAVGTTYNTVTGVFEDTLYHLSDDAGSFQFHNNGALTHITTEDDIVGGVWSESDGNITIRFIKHIETFQLVPQALPLNQGTIIHNVELDVNTTVIEIQTF